MTQHDHPGVSDDVLAEILTPPGAWPEVLPSVHIRCKVEDFEVEEIPRYEPSGEGEHLFLWIQKTDTSASQLITRLSKGLGVAQRDIGVAGQKDRRAVTRQFVSIPYSFRNKLDDFKDSGIEVLSAVPHGNKLRTGHLSGNRFSIVLRTREPGLISKKDVEQLSAKLCEIQSGGIPNYFGTQRFGHGGRSLTDGIQLLGNPDFAKQLAPAQRRFLRKMLPSAVQSGIFNLVLAQRVTDGTFRTPIDGDIVCRRTGTRPFALSEAHESASELTPMGPMPGRKMQPATDSAAEVERRAFVLLGIPPDTFDTTGKLTPGTRRRMVTFPEEASCQAVDDSSLRLTFVLPPGSYATVLLLQLCKAINEGPPAVGDSLRTSSRIYRKET